MMEIHDLTGRLRRCMAAGLLSWVDLGHWFELPRATIRAWVEDARLPRESRLPEIDARLNLLETVIHEGAFPVPHALSQHRRPTYIREQYHAAIDRGVSASATR